MQKLPKQHYREIVTPRFWGSDIRRAARTENVHSKQISLTVEQIDDWKYWSTVQKLPKYTTGDVTPGFGLRHTQSGSD